MSKDTRGTVKAKTYSVPKSAMYNAPDGDYYYLTVVELADYMALATKLDIAEFACAAVVAENAGLKHAMAVTLEHVSVTDAGQAGVAAMIINDALHHSETPATDAFLAEIERKAIRKFINSIEYILRDKLSPYDTEEMLEAMRIFLEEQGGDKL